MNFNLLAIVIDTADSQHKKSSQLQQKQGLGQKQNNSSRLDKYQMQSSSSLKAFELFMTDHEFYIRTTQKQYSSQQFSGIKINRLTSKLTELQQKQFVQETGNINAKFKEFVDSVMGVVVVNSQAYLLVVKEIQCVAMLEKERVHQIKDTKFIPFKHKFLYNSIDQTQNQKILSFLKQQLLKDNFYFCYNQDLTLTYTKRFDRQSTQRKFWWNESMLSIFQSYNLKPCFNIKVIQGHVRQIYCENQYFSFYYAMISRRSKEMSGTRFNHRGLNEQYDVSNFVQTEEIFVCHNFLFSHVSLRGSVPLFWKQESVKTDIVLKHKLEEEHQKAIISHYQALSSEYKGRICTINLLSKQKMPQKDLKSRFEYYYFRALKQQQQTFMYLYFDLNEQMKDQNGQKAIDMFMNASKEIFSGQENFFVIDRFTRQVISVQKIYPRINCLDCIDRTNVIMARVSEHYLHQIQAFINSRANIKEKYLKLTSGFKKNLISLWVQLGNRISMLYCGTQSVANHMTKKQNNSFFSFLSGGIKSINRYYNASVNDNYKHECIDYLLGKKGVLSQTSYFQDNITRKILDQTKYCTFQSMKLYMVTWNCSMVDPFALTKRQRQKMFTFLNNEMDLVVFCLQEIVQLNSYNVLLGNNDSILGSWAKVILECLNDPEINKHSSKQFCLYTYHDLVGIATLVFCTKQVSNKIEQFEWLDIKTGFKGNSGHKGAVILFMQIQSSWFTIINCHLASGHDKRSERYQDIEFMHNQAIKQRRIRRLLDLSEFRFFVGDMNFCMQLSGDIVRTQLSKIQTKDKQKKLTQQELRKLLQPLLMTDQKTLTKLGHLCSYEEPQIRFLPTYRFDTKTKTYDTKKIPSWYDRILYRAQDYKKMKIIRYNDIDVYLSDHKPVYAMVELLVKKQNLQRKKKFLELYLKS